MTRQETWHRCIEYFWGEWRDERKVLWWKTGAFLEKWEELDAVCVCEGGEQKWDERQRHFGGCGLHTHWRGCMSEIAQQKEAQQIQINIIIKSVINTKAFYSMGRISPRVTDTQCCGSTCVHGMSNRSRSLSHTYTHTQNAVNQAKTKLPRTRETS